MTIGGAVAACLAAAAALLLVACGAAKSHAPPVTAAAQPTTVAPTTSTTAPPITYQVKPGDTLSSIANQFGVAIGVLVARNHLANLNRLSVGQTLLVPAPPSVPAHLAITPAHGPAGQTFTFVVDGARSAETITFRIDSPGGGTFTGPPHTASPAGGVTAFYATNGADTPGTYTVTATGDHHSSAKATFSIDAPATTG